MSIETLIKAAAYLDRKDRGELRPFIFLQLLLYYIFLYVNNYFYCKPASPKLPHLTRNVDRDCL